MSGIYIPGMEMPENGWHKVIKIFSDGTVVSYYDSVELAKAIPVPDHGRLIDADALWDVAYKAWGTEYDPWVCNLFMEMINNAPTIIPAGTADKEEEG